MNSRNAMMFSQLLKYKCYLSRVTLLLVKFLAQQTKNTSQQQTGQSMAQTNSSRFLPRKRATITVGPSRLNVQHLNSSHLLPQNIALRCTRKPFHGILPAYHQQQEKAQNAIQRIPILLDPKPSAGSVYDDLVLFLHAFTPLITFGLICNSFRFACFVNSSLRFLIPNLHPICTCSCLFTPLTEGRSARDLTQAATSQKKYTS